MSAETRRTRALERAAQAWCDPRTSDRVMDPELAEVFADFLLEEMYAPHLGCATTGELLVELKARAEVDGTLDYKTIDSDD